MTTRDFIGGAALVTGAGSGIGRAVALALIGRGASVAALDRDQESLTGLEALARRSGAAGQLLTRRIDVTDGAAVASVADAIEEELGPLRWLVSGAGVLIPGALLGEGAGAALDAQYAVHVQGLSHLMRAVIPRMLARREGSAVAISSNAGDVPRVGMGAYCASKAAETMLMKCYALELAPHVRCNVVSPGSTDTPMLRGMVGEGGYDQLIVGDTARFKLGIPLGRVAEPADIAEAVLFLLSPAARHITGHDLRIDGGATP